MSDFITSPTEVVKVGEPLSNSDAITKALEKGELYKRGFDDGYKRGKEERPTSGLISREALKEHKLPIPLIGDYQQGWNDAIDIIYDNAPTLPNPCGNPCNFIRPTGEWYYSCQNGWHCSICQQIVKDMPTVMGKANFDYCPNCGAKMKEAEE